MQGEMELEVALDVGRQVRKSVPEVGFGAEWMGRCNLSGKSIPIQVCKNR